MNDRILIAGAAGRLAASIADVFAGSEVIAHTRATLDITDPEAVRRVVVEAGIVSEDEIEARIAEVRQRLGLGEGS